MFFKFECCDTTTYLANINGEESVMCGVCKLYSFAQELSAEQVAELDLPTPDTEISHGL